MMKAWSLLLLSLLVSLVILFVPKPMHRGVTSSAQSETEREVPRIRSKPPDQDSTRGLTRTTTRSATPNGEVTDAIGDVLELLWLTPYQDGERGLTISGRAVNVSVPNWLISDPSSFYWYGGTERPSADGEWIDYAPHGKRARWSSGSASQTNDPTDASLAGYEDVTRLSISQANASHIQFEWLLRGTVPSGRPDVDYVFALGSTPDNPDPVDWFIHVYPWCGARWRWWTHAITASFYWRSTSYEDIASARVDDLGDGRLKVEMTLASVVPAKPADNEGEPWFVWWFDVDNDPSTGNPCYGDDMDVVVRYNRSSQQWEGALRRFNGDHFEDVPGAAPIPVTRDGCKVSAVVSISELGLSSTFRWRSVASLKVGTAGEMFYSDVDVAPDDGWVKDAYSEPGVFLPLVVRD
jgi:hypothetical protein